MSGRQLVAFTLCACVAACSSGSAGAMKPQEVPDAAPAAAHVPQEFSIAGFYSEACSCSMPCPCELTGPIMSCKGIGAYQFDEGRYGSDDFSGCRMAYSLYIGRSVQLYIDAPTDAKRAATERFARVALAGFGPVTAVHAAKVEIAGRDGAYHIQVDGGRIMDCTNEPFMGGDRKTPIVHSNTFDAMNPVMYQAQCLGCTYSDGDMKITLDKGSNSYFNAHMKADGKL